MALILTEAEIPSVMLQTAPAQVYEAPTGSSLRIMAANLVNNDPSNAVTYRLWRVPEGGAPNDGNALTPATYEIPGNSRKDVAELLRLAVPAGWSIWGQAGTSNVLVLTLSGSVFTET